MNQLKKGAILNYVTIILTTGVALLLTPFIIKNLGDAEFGLYTLIGAFVGYISVLDFGLTNTIVRFVAKYRAEKDRIAEENFLATTMIIYICISVLVVGVGLVCYLNLEMIFNESLTLDQIDRAKVMFGILIFNLAIALPGGAFAGICSGYEEFVFPKTVNIIRYLVRSVAVLGILSLGGKAISLVVLDTTMNITVIIVQGYFVLNKLKVKFKLHHLQNKLIRKIFNYSFWIFLSVLISQFQWQGGQMVLGIVANTTVVAIYAIGVMLGTYYGAFSGAIAGVFLPRATQMSVNNASGEELTNMMIKIGRISLIVLFYILAAFAVFGKQFVFLWVGENYYDSWIVALIIMIAYTVPLIQAFGNSILEAKNKMSFKVILYIICIGGGTAFGALLAKNYGPIGMITGSAIGWMIGQQVLNVYYEKKIKINILRFFKEVFRKTARVFLLALIFGFFTNLIPGQNWLNFIFKGFIFTIFYGFTMFHLGMFPYEKELFSTPIILAVKKVKTTFLKQ